MSKRFDATLKTLLEVSPVDWPRLAGHPVKRAEVIEADVSTITAATDKVVRVFGEYEGLMHFDFQAGPDGSLTRRVVGYNVLLEARHKMPVQSVVVLLRPEANLRSLTGVYERWFPGSAQPNLIFRYQIIRVWEVPAEQFLAGGVGTLALAPIGAVNEAELPGVVQQLKEKLEAPRYRKLAGSLWTAVDILMGLRYERALVENLLRGVRGMKESVTYQAIVEEGVEKGQLQGAKRILFRLGEELLGPPSAGERSRVESVGNVEALERLTERALKAQSWDELLADLPAPPPRRTRKRKA